jgi:potassium-transporting ATPase KdpC subunit
VKIKLSKIRAENGDKNKSRIREHLRPLAGVAVISLLLAGVFFPFLITGIGQFLFPYQANGEIVHLNGQAVGSNLIDNGFNLTIFFHARPANDSASGVDPDINLPDAFNQSIGISNATGIPVASLNQIISQNTEGTFWIFGFSYVNVLHLNIILIQKYPSVYKNYTVSSS